MASVGKRKVNMPFKRSSHLPYQATELCAYASPYYSMFTVPILSVQHALLGLLTGHVRGHNLERRDLWELSLARFSCYRAYFFLIPP